MKILRISIISLFSFFGGAFLAIEFWINPWRASESIQAGALEKIDNLLQIKSGKIDDLIEKKENEMDADILALGALSSEPGRIGASSKRTLHQIAKYRLNSKHIIVDVNTREKVRYFIEKYK